MAEALKNSICFVGIDVGKNSFHVVGLDGGGAIVLRQKWSRGQVAARFANMPPCLIGMEACVGAHHLSRKTRDADFSVSSPLDRPAIDPQFPVWGACLHRPSCGAPAVAASLQSIERSKGIANAAKRLRPQSGRQP